MTEIYACTYGMLTNVYNIAGSIVNDGLPKGNCPYNYRENVLIVINFKRWGALLYTNISIVIIACGDICK